MNKHLLKYIVFCFIGLLSVSCNNSESDLLEPKVYFENKEHTIEVTDAESFTYDLQARISDLCPASVEVAYEIADASVIETYNAKYGTQYEAFDASNASISSTTAVVLGGEIYAETVALELSNLNTVEEGKSFLLPVRIKSASLPTMDGADITYLIITKPIRIMRVGSFSSNHIKVPFPAATIYTSITYEALVYFDRFGNNNTIMGCEGKLILRSGDTPLVAANRLQIAGEKEFSAAQDLNTKQWYHVAYTYDLPSGKTAIYINGEKASESSWDNASFEFGDFFIGKVAGFMWGERPLNGRLSEIRIWNVSRTENQIKQNMTNIDPTTDGLNVYYKLNGTDQFQENGVWYIRDASGHNLHGLANGGSRALSFLDLDEPLEVK